MTPDEAHAAEERLFELEAEFKRRGQTLAITHAVWEHAAKQCEEHPSQVTIAATLGPMRETSDAAIAFGAAVRRFVDFAQPLLEAGVLYGEDDYEPDDEENDDGE